MTYNQSICMKKILFYMHSLYKIYILFSYIFFIKRFIFAFDLTTTKNQNTENKKYKKIILRAYYCK